MMLHPNKRPFIGVLAFLDQPSDKAPAGARGHRVILTESAARFALPTLIGMGINVADRDSQKHQPTSKVGVIETAEISGREIVVSGHIFARDFPAVIDQLAASSEYGMSYEMADAHVEDMRASDWKLTKVTFTGAAVLLRAKAAYKFTDFILL